MRAACAVRAVAFLGVRLGLCGRFAAALGACLVGGPVGLVAVGAVVLCFSSGGAGRLPRAVHKRHVSSCPLPLLCSALCVPPWCGCLALGAVALGAVRGWLASHPGRFLFFPVCAVARWPPCCGRLWRWAPWRWAPFRGGALATLQTRVLLVPVALLRLAAVCGRFGAFASSFLADVLRSSLALRAVALGAVLGRGISDTTDACPPRPPRAGVRWPQCAVVLALGVVVPAPLSPPSARAWVVGWCAGCPQGGRWLAQVGVGAAGCPCPGSWDPTTFSTRAPSVRGAIRSPSIGSSGLAAAHALRGVLDVHLVINHRSYCRYS